MPSEEYIKRQRLFISDWYKLNNSMIRLDSQSRKLKNNTKYNDSDNLNVLIDQSYIRIRNLAMELVIFDLTTLLDFRNIKVKQLNLSAIRNTETGQERVQIRYGILHPKYVQEDTLDPFALKKVCDFTILVTYDNNMRPQKIYETSKAEIKKAITDLKIANERFAVSQFISISKVIWQK